MNQQDSNLLALDPSNLQLQNNTEVDKSSTHKKSNTIKKQSQQQSIILKSVIQNKISKDNGSIQVNNQNKLNVQKSYDTNQENSQKKLLQEYNLSKKKETIQLVGDILEQRHINNSMFQSNYEEDDEKLNDQNANDRLRKIFSRKIGRFPKTPPKRIHSNQLSNQQLIDMND